MLSAQENLLPDLFMDPDFVKQRFGVRLAKIIPASTFFILLHMHPDETNAMYAYLRLPYIGSHFD